MAGNWGTSDDIEQYRRDFALFLERIAIASEGNPPPGSNAANGWFVKAVRDDAEIKNVAPPRAKADDPQAEKIFSILSIFEGRVMEAFTFENYKSSWTKSGKLAFDALDAMKGDLAKIAASIRAVITWDAPALIALGKSIDDLIKNVHKSGLQYEGAHANGHINQAVLDAANQAKASFDAVVSAQDGDPLAIAFSKASSTIMQDIIAIGKLDNDPWLEAAWQIRMQAICRLGSELLLEVRVPATPTVPAPGGASG